MYTVADLMVWSAYCAYQHIGKSASVYIHNKQVSLKFQRRIFFMIPNIFQFPLAEKLAKLFIV